MEQYSTDKYMAILTHASLRLPPGLSLTTEDSVDRLPANNRGATRELTVLLTTSAWCFIKLQSTLVCAWTGCLTASNVLKKSRPICSVTHAPTRYKVMSFHQHLRTSIKILSSLQLSYAPPSRAEAHTPTM